MRGVSTSRLTSLFSGGAPDLRRTAADPNASAKIGRVHFIVTRPLQRVVRGHLARRSLCSLSNDHSPSTLVLISAELRLKPYLSYKPWASRVCKTSWVCRRR